MGMIRMKRVMKPMKLCEDSGRAGAAGGICQGALVKQPIAIAAPWELGKFGVMYQFGMLLRGLAEFSHAERGEASLVLSSGAHVFRRISVTEPMPPSAYADSSLRPSTGSGQARNYIMQYESQPDSGKIIRLGHRASVTWRAVEILEGNAEYFFVRFRDGIRDVVPKWRARFISFPARPAIGPA